MAGYVKLKDKDPKYYDEPEKRFKIVKAKLVAKLDEKPNDLQKFIIDNVVPLVLTLMDWRAEFLKSGKLHPRFMQTYNTVRSTFGQLYGSAKIRTGKSGAADDKNEDGDLWGMIGDEGEGE